MATEIQGFNIWMSTEMYIANIYLVNGLRRHSATNIMFTGNIWSNLRSNDIFSVEESHGEEVWRQTALTSQTQPLFSLVLWVSGDFKARLSGCIVCKPQIHPRLTFVLFHLHIICLSADFQMVEVDIPVDIFNFQTYFVLSKAGLSQ